MKIYQTKFVQVNVVETGGEDDDVSLRIRCTGYRIDRPPQDVARYTMMKHTRDHLNPVNSQRFHLLNNVTERWTTDGLNSVAFRVVEMQLRSLYTWILLDVSLP